MLDTFHVEVQRLGPDSCEVAIAGELDLATAADVRAVLHQAVTRYERITVDLSSLRFCDCAGLSALLAAARTAQDRGAEFRLRTVPLFLVRLLRLSRTHGVFTIEPAAQ